MKSYHFLWAASIVILAACSGIKELDGVEESTLGDGELVERVIFEVPEIRYLGEDVETKATLDQSGDNAINFAWETVDTVGIYPNTGAQVFFSMENGAGTNVANFDGGGWALKQGSTYSCYYPFIGNMYLKREAIPVSFAGQTQSGTSSFVGVRWYLASEGTSSVSGALRFTFQMLNTIIRIKPIGLPAGTYTKLSLAVDEPLFVQEGTFGLNDMAITGKTYSNTLEITLDDFTLAAETTDANPVLVYLTSAPVDLSGKKVTVRVYASDGTVYKCEKTPSKVYEAGAWGGLKCVMEKEGSESQLPYVEMAPGVYWATNNVGADNPWDYGDYFAWGETTPKSDYSWSTYRYGTSSTSLTKYNASDGKTVLDISDDAASANLTNAVGLWRIPTDAEWSALFDTSNYTWTWVSDYESSGVSGYTVTSKVQGCEGNMIFLPAAGRMIDTNSTPSYDGVEGYYWSSSLSETNTYSAIIAGVYSWNNGPSFGTRERNAGISVRAVYDPSFIYGHKYVEMGDGLKWATMNVGANSETDYGDYFAWGETSTKTDYSWATYQHLYPGMSTYTGINKYQIADNQTSAMWYYDGEFIGDGKTELERTDDAASAIWGGTWRMPTDEEWTELRNTDKFIWSWTESYNGTGVKGYTVTSRVPGYVGNQIFLPAAGYRSGTSLYSAGSGGYYWSSSLNTGYSSYAWSVYFNSSSVLRSYDDRYYGQSVRPVSE